MSDTLHVLSAGAAKGLVEALRWEFEKASARSLQARFGAVGAIKEELLQGAPCDVVILTSRMLEDLVGDGLVDLEGIRPLGRVSTGIAVPSGQPHPSVHDGSALATVLAGASAVHIPDPKRATAGIHFMNVLDRLGIRVDVEPRLATHPSGAVAMRALADAGDGSAVGCTQVTEILYTRGVELVGSLPAGFELSTVYAAAVCRRAQSRSAANRLVELLSGDATAMVRREGGFEPA